MADLPFGIISITCDPNRDPPVILIAFPGGLTSEVPKAFYDSIREASGLPDVVCG